MKVHPSTIFDAFPKDFAQFLTNPNRYTPSRQVDTKSASNLKQVMEKFKQENEEKMSKLKQDFITEFRISETDSVEDKMIHILLPNVYKDEVTIESYKNQLTVTFEQNEEETAKFVPNSFTKTFTFGEEFDMDKISTNLEYGVLNIIVPKKDKANQKFETKMIQIN